MAILSFVFSSKLHDGEANSFVTDEQGFVGGEDEEHGQMP